MGYCKHMSVILTLASQAELISIFPDQIGLSRPYKKLINGLKRLSLLFGLLAQFRSLIAASTKID